jgi:hypothetical protein
MSNPFEIAAQALIAAPPTLSLAVPATRPGPKPKPLAQRRTLYALQLARRDTSPITATADGLLA